jgi:hypothetical protein
VPSRANPSFLPFRLNQGAKGAPPKTLALARVRVTG